MITRHTQHFLFTIGDKVIVSEIQRPGIIEALTVDRTGPSYRVRFWDDGKRENLWLDADELELRIPRE